MIDIAIVGYGNLGKGVECAISKTDDIRLTAIFSRRNDVKSLSGVPVLPIEELDNFSADCLILCGGSATDLPVSTPIYAKKFNVVDSFDTHAKIPEHFENVDKEARESCHTAIISSGWDPGLFSLARLYFSSILPKGNDYTFWGKGVSQGHSDAIRRINGVVDARQYTIPVEQAMEKVRSGLNPTFTTREKHKRECFVVAESGADLEYIENQIKTMPNYFADYDTTVHFVSAEVLKAEHNELPHGGSVIKTGNTGWNDEYKNVLELKLKLDSNPMFTAGVLVASARAVVRMSKNKNYGAKTLFDVPPAYLSPMTEEEIRNHLL